MADAGIGETMLISAALGGGTSALRGQDPLKGALMGGALGGIGYGLSSALGGAFGTTGEALTAGEAAGSAFAPQATAGVDYSGLIPTETGFYDPVSMTDVTAPVRTASGLAADQINNMTSLSAGAKNAYIQAINSGGMDPTQAVKEAAMTNRYLAGPPSGIAGLGEKAANWAAANPTKAALGFSGLPGLLSMTKPGTGTLANLATSQAYSGPLSFFKYDPRLYTPDTPMPPSPAYRAQYADGGIAALAQGGLNAPTGPVERMSQQTVGAGGMYPQSQMDKTYFATPTQMPASAEVIGADYDARTNPYTGVMMASGGIASLGSIDDIIEDAKTTRGGMADLAAKARKDDTNALAAMAKMQQRKMLEEQHGHSLAHGGITALKEGSFVVPADVVSHMGNGSTDAGIAALRKHTGAKAIRGHGDGMSDSIPTSIDGRQPARVADGEAIIEPEHVKRIGKGSSKDGAKKLYAMMDKVRKARTGTEKQGRQINPAKYMPA